MICFPNARITLGLQVKAKRADGYHDIETLMLPVSMHDALEVVPASDNRTRLFLSGTPINGNAAENLVMKAWEMIKEAHLATVEDPNETLPPIHIFLRKAIPSGSGLAGGSSDGAFMLKLLNTYFRLNLADKKLYELAAKTGSDCSFFIQDKAKIVRGRGETLVSVNTPDLSTLYLVIVVPPIHIKTSEAYKLIKPNPDRVPLKELLKKPLKKWQNDVINDFEPVLFKSYPYLEKIKRQMIGLGAVYASLSGSGSSLYGFFNNPDALSALQKDFPNCLTGCYRILSS